MAALLDRRNTNLAKFISLITMLCHYTEQDQVDYREPLSRILSSVTQLAIATALSLEKS
jgi:hypothetical protein